MGWEYCEGEKGIKKEKMICTVSVLFEPNSLIEPLKKSLTVPSFFASPRTLPELSRSTLLNSKSAPSAGPEYTHFFRSYR